MSKIDQLMNDIIPPPTYYSRNGFSNEDLINGLNSSERKEVERLLIERLKKDADTLIGETLVYLNSSRSLKVMREIINQTTDSVGKIIWASYVNQIKNGDPEMKEIAFKEMDSVSDKHSLTLVFHFLTKFKDKRINGKVKAYVKDPDSLISYNARSALKANAMSAELIEKVQKNKNRTWWEEWF